MIFHLKCFCNDISTGCVLFIPLILNTSESALHCLGPGMQRTYCRRVWQTNTNIQTKCQMVEMKQDIVLLGQLKHSYSLLFKKAQQIYSLSDCLLHYSYCSFLYITELLFINSIKSRANLINDSSMTHLFVSRKRTDKFMKI